MRLGIKIRQSDIPIHHYGKLNTEKITDKGKAYLEIDSRRLNEQEEENIDAICQLAIQASELGLHEKALEYWDKVIALKPDLPRAHYGKGISYFHFGRYEEANNSLKKAIDLAPNSRDVILLFSSCEIYAGHAENAISYLKKLLAKDPSFTMAMINLAMAYFCASQKDKGLEYIKKLTDKKINFTKLFHDYVKITMSTKNYQYAIYLLQAATETGNVIDDTTALLSECYRKRQLNQKIDC